MPAGSRSRDAAAGLGASPDGADEEVDGPEGQERQGVLGAAAPHGRHSREDGAASARSRPGLHQPAQQGESTPTCRLWKSILHSV